MDHARVLLRTPIFQDLAVTDVEELFPDLRERRYARGDSVWHEGDSATVLCIVADGQLKAHRVSRDGRDLTLGIYPAVSVTGEVGLFHPAGVRWLGLSAMTETRCLMLGRAPLLGFLARHPAAMQRMFESLSMAAVLAAYSASGMAFESISGRVATLLLHLADEYGESTTDGVRIRMRLSQGDLAAYVGASRENVNRALAAFVSSGVVGQRSGHFFVHDLAALKSAAGPAAEV